MTTEEVKLKYQSEKRKTKRIVTKEKLEKVNPQNIKAYDQYLKTSIVKNRDVKNTTYKVYQSYFNMFLVYIMEEWDNFYILDEDFIEENMVDVLEAYMAYMQEELGNGKKAINTKIASISSFYQWCVKRRKIKAHPFAGRLDRMKNPHSEKRIAEYFLTEKQVSEIEAELSLVGNDGYSEYDMQDKLLWHIAFDSACRIGALSGLKISNFDPENKRFVNIREKRGKIVSVPFTDPTLKMIQEFIEQRKELGVDCDEFFYTKVDGEYRGMSKQTMTRRIRALGYIVGLGDFRPHCIRKTRLNMIAEIDINLAKTLANHESLDTTARFYTEEKDLSDVLNTISDLEKTTN